MNEQEAIRRLKSGDIGGLAELVERYQVQAVRTAYLVTHDTTLAEDVVQDVFLQMYQHIGSFDVKRPFAPWFMRCVVNAAVRVSKSSQRDISLDNSAMDDYERDEQIAFADLLPALDANPEQAVEAAEVEAQVEAALLNLSPEQRAAVVMRYYLELSDDEISAALDCAPSTVRWRLHTARKQLRVILQRMWVALLISQMW